MLKQINKVSRLHKNEQRLIQNLFDRCAQHDKFRTRFYWNILQNRLTMEFNDFLYYIDGNLVGYLALFTFLTDEAEMTAIVHPKYRKTGIFKQLLAEALLELKLRNVSRCVWICPQSSVIDSQQMKKMKGKYLFSQMQMMASREPISTELPHIILRQVNSADLVTISKMGAESFKASYQDTFQRFTENLQEKKRKAWLISTPQYENVGKIHVRYDDNKTAFIHDLCTVPEHRGKKIAMAAILKMMGMLREEGQRVITLDVECHNKGALKLYEHCGFDVTSAYDFWRVGTKQMEEEFF